MGGVFGDRDDTRFLEGLTSLIVAASSRHGISWTPEAQSHLAYLTRTRLKEDDPSFIPSEFIRSSDQTADEFMDVLDPGVLVAFNFGRAAATLTSDTIEEAEVTESTVLGWLSKLCPPPLPPFC